MNRRSFFASLVAAFVAPKVIDDVVTKTIPYADDVLLFGSNNRILICTWRGRTVNVSEIRAVGSWSLEQVRRDSALALWKETPYSL